MIYGLVLGARKQFDLGLVDGFGFTVNTGEFWMNHGDASAKAKEYCDMLEASWRMLGTKDSHIREFEVRLSQVDSVDASLASNQGPARGKFLQKLEPARPIFIGLTIRPTYVDWYYIPAGY